MKYKVGDKVVVKSKAWYDENKDENGNVQMKFNSFVDSMAELCGKTVTISEIYNKGYRIKEEPHRFYWYDDMFEDSNPKTLEIHIPEGKTPKMTETTNSCVIEWGDKEKTFDDYVRKYRELLRQDLGLSLNNAPVLNWCPEFKFGLLKFIADDLNEEELDWENPECSKYAIYYDNVRKKVLRDWCSVSHRVGYIFTDMAAGKALKIIPEEFLKSF